MGLVIYLSSFGLIPAGLIRTLALDINAEVADLNLDICTRHNKAWDLVQRLRDHTRELYGPLIDLSVPRPDQRPLILGYIFATAAGRVDVNAGPPQEQRDDLLLAAGRIMRQFQEEGHGSVVKDRAAKEVDVHERVEGLECEEDDVISRGILIRRVWLGLVVRCSDVGSALGLYRQTRAMKQGQLRLFVQILWDTHSALV
jgi:hypothetical protein